MVEAADMAAFGRRRTVSQQAAEVIKDRELEIELKQPERVVTLET